jgi:predicted ATPase/DNA-binding SARP family transcriptional activator
MPEPLVVNLLGPPRFSQAEVAIACASRKSLGLFAYLMLSTRSHARRELAALMWGRRDEETARASLRVALHRLPPAMAECLLVDRDSIVVAAPPLVDVARFETLAKGDDLDSLERATEIYQGELLQDFEADATPEFDDWLHAQRTRLAQVAQQAFDGTIARRAERARRDAARATRERESALATGRRWLALMPGAEAAHRWLMQLYLDMGRRDAALTQYELCQRFLAVTYGRAPSQETRELHEFALGRAAMVETAAPPEAADAAKTEPVARSLVPATSFVGRIEELAELDRLLAEPGCRLLTLHGLGGAGKTRLAHALATQVGARFAQGVAWVGLETVDSAEALSTAIAAALGRELPPRGDHAMLVADMLASQQRLLVLDNMETVLARDAGADPIAIVTRILERAPQVRMVVTSREVLGLQEEWVYDVHGLPHTAEPLATAPAVELFAQRARQAYLGFSLSAEMPHVMRICSLVEGLPLGIELAAAWVRTIPCGEIAAAIEHEATALASAHRNRAERHRTLEAVVGYSWNLLRGEEQRALAALSAFAGGFTRETAERVAEASMRTLSALVDKSLVRRKADGRYDLHELVRQFAWAKLRKTRTREAQVVRRHADTFAGLLLQWSDQSKGPGEVEARRGCGPSSPTSWLRGSDRSRWASATSSSASRRH